MVNGRACSFSKNDGSSGLRRSVDWGSQKASAGGLTSPSRQKGKVLVRSHLREEHRMTREEQLQAASQRLSEAATLLALAGLSMLAEEVEELALQANLQAAE